LYHNSTKKLPKPYQKSERATLLYQPTTTGEKYLYEGLAKDGGSGVGISMRGTVFKELRKLPSTPGVARTKGGL